MSQRPHLLVALLAIFLIQIANVSAQTQTSDPEKELFRTVESLDTGLFEAVNQCDMQKVQNYWADDAVFLHDKVPPMIGRAVIVDTIKNNLCGTVLRELLPGTLEVHSLKDYGAVEIGVHRFLHPFSQDHGVIGQHNAGHQL
ncbi:MAG TPA: nuclear transport factor 2 family protein [Terriglobales bacterium]|nr:nuclear transport factor 2 family protein [Terriglobales bacterium]